MSETNIGIIPLDDYRYTLRFSKKEQKIKPKQNVISIILARKGSKGLKNKNIIDLVENP